MYFAISLHSLVQVASESQRNKDNNRQRRASESDTMLEHKIVMGPPPPHGVDIVQMLSKAQHEYDQVNQVRIFLQLYIYIYTYDVFFFYCSMISKLLFRANTRGGDGRIAPIF